MLDVCDLFCRIDIFYYFSTCVTVLLKIIQYLSAVVKFMQKQNFEIVKCKSESRIRFPIVLLNIDCC